MWILSSGPGGLLITETNSITTLPVAPPVTCLGTSTGDSFGGWTGRMLESVPCPRLQELEKERERAQSAGRQKQAKQETPQSAKNSHQWSSGQRKEALIPSPLPDQRPDQRSN